MFEVISTNRKTGNQTVTIRCATRAQAEELATRFTLCESNPNVIYSVR